MLKISVGSNKLHLILLFFIIFSIIMAPTVETVFSCLKDAWTFFRRSFIMQFICVIYTNILYIKLAANSCQVFIKLNLWPEAAWWKMAPSNQQTGSFMDWCTINMTLILCALIKHMFKTDLQRAESLCTKDFTDVQTQNLALKCSQKFKGKKNNSSSLKINSMPRRVFWAFERQRRLFDSP